MNTLLVINGGGGDISFHVLNDQLSKQIDIIKNSELSNDRYQEAIVDLIYNEKYDNGRNPEVVSIHAQDLVLEKCPVNLNFDQVVYFDRFGL